MIRRTRQVLRLVHINLVLVRHGLDDIILATHLMRPVRWLAYLMPWNWFRTREPRGVRIRKALEELGPIFVKFGQILSTRSDLMPPDIAIELARLQDRVPPFSGSMARQTIERGLKGRVTELFSDFNETPLASASIAQVHAATLKDGREVVIKVVRPGIEQTIGRDVALLKLIAEMAERYWADGRRLHPVEVVKEFEKTLFDELDLMREASNAAQLRHNFKDSELLYVPEIHWQWCRRECLVMERIRGIPISDTEALVAAGVSLEALSSMGVEIFFTQVFRDSFFHADMHPGNIFVDITNPARPRYIAVDFGIMGTLNPVDQHYLAENFLAFFNRDYRRVAELHIESGWVPHGTRVDEFESAIRTVSEPIFGKPLREISFGHFLLRLFQTARRFDMEVQPQLVLLQKTLLAIEGLGRRLDPDLDLWQTAKPFLERFMSEQVGLRSWSRGMKENAPEWGRQLPEIPGLLHRFLDDSVHGRLSIRQQSSELEGLRHDIRQGVRRFYYTVSGAVLLLGAMLHGRPDGDEAYLLFGLPLGAVIMGAVGALFLAAAWPRDKQ
ncbi:MAG: ubiquinone biosynthesis regulatory protein kinase UbiB [Gammaproteobacteria bacterium]